MKQLLVLLMFLFVMGCTKQQEVIQMGALKLTSPAFDNNGTMPAKYACDGDNISPQLNIQGVPESAVSLVLIVDDPDAPAGTWVHWVVWNIPADASVIDEGAVPGTQGLNDFKKHEYGGPCPPSGTHHYMFRLYALDTELDLDENSKKSDVEKAMKGHILAQTKLVGLYSRQ